VENKGFHHVSVGNKQRSDELPAETGQPIRGCTPEELKKDI